jgi:uncharacterized membrane-anchored protein
MNDDQLENIIRAAIAEGILPAHAAVPAPDHRPWPVLMLTAFGAWLAAVPLVAILFVSLSGILSKGAGPYIVGILLLAATVGLLRKDKLPLFVEQFTVPGLLVAGITLGVGLFHDLPDRAAAGMLALLALSVGLVVARSWLCLLLGAAACALSLLAFDVGAHPGDSFTNWHSLQLALAGWLGAQFVLRSVPQRAFERLATGWLIMTLAGLAIWTGMTFLAGASLGIGPSGSGWRAMEQPGMSLAQVCSAATAAAAAVALAWRWPSLRTPWSALSALILLGMAWLMPSLGAVLLILSLSAAKRRWAVAIAAGAAAAWIIGAFYYQLSYPLATKALMMAGAGAILGAMAWSVLRRRMPRKPSNVAAQQSPAAWIGITVCACAVLAVANIGIWQKETLIAEGRPVFVEIVPVDPRSLLQGDYMRLAFRLPGDPRSLTADAGSRTAARVVGAVDARGVVHLTRFDDNTPLAPGEISLPLVQRHHRPTLVTDAWYFKEGEAQRWARAKYGEFRVDASGRALLVGLRGPELEPL